MDGAPFESAYLKMIDDKPTLFYEYTFQNPGLEFFVHVNTKPTWEELKKYVTEKLQSQPNQVIT